MSESLSFTFNEDMSLLMMPKTNENQSKLIRTFTFINLIDVLDIQKKEQENLYINKIDENSMVQNFNGLTFFELFKHNPDYIDLLLKKIKSSNILDNVQVDESGETIDNILIRKIYWTLNFPVLKHKKD